MLFVSRKSLMGCKVYKYIVTCPESIPINIKMKAQKLKGEECLCQSVYAFWQLPQIKSVMTFLLPWQKNESCEKELRFKSNLASVCYTSRSCGSSGTRLILNFSFVFIFFLQDLTEVLPFNGRDLLNLFVFKLKICTMRQF